MLRRKNKAELEREALLNEYITRTINAEDALRKLANAIGSLGSHGPTDQILHKINRLADEAVEVLKKR